MADEDNKEEIQSQEGDDSASNSAASDLAASDSEASDDEASDEDALSDDDDESVLTASDDGYIDHYDEETLPPYACRYCGIHDPASVARCVESNKWFCNVSFFLKPLPLVSVLIMACFGYLLLHPYTFHHQSPKHFHHKTKATCVGGGGSHLVHHLVRSRSNQVQLHPESPLGDTVLECYNCASKNSFVLGFVPASSSSVVVLLCRVCVETVPALKDMDWELGQWHPLVQDRKFLPWLVTVSSTLCDILAGRGREPDGWYLDAVQSQEIV